MNIGKIEASHGIIKLLYVFLNYQNRGSDVAQLLNWEDYLMGDL